MKKNDIIQLHIARHTHDGQGIAHLPDGRVCFVSGALAGEDCTVKLIKLGKRAAWGLAVSRSADAPERIQPDCPYFPKCGGCQLRHMSYDAELAAKKQHIIDVLHRIGGFDLTDFVILGANHTNSYRNKAIFPVGGTTEAPQIGFYRSRSHQIVDVSFCLLQHPAAALVRQTVLAWMTAHAVAPYDERTRCGLLRHLLVRTNQGGEVLVCLLGNGKALPHADALCAALRESVPRLRGVVFGQNTRHDNVILGERFETLWGDDALTETLCRLTYRIGIDAFFQINHAQTERLYALAADFAALTGGETLLDLYCGIGSIGLSMADRAARLIGVEVVETAVRNAAENAAANGIANAEFFCGDAGEIAESLAASGSRPDVIVFDPPRKGLSLEAIDAAVSMRPDRMVYVSCDPATFARDAKLLAERGYALADFAAADLFPRTKHVECVGLLAKKKNLYISK